jgi:hypothetical protein
LFVSLLLAVGGSVAAFCGFLTLRHATGEDAPAKPLPVLTEPPRPERLPPAPEFGSAAVPAAAQRPRARPVDVSIRVRGLTADLAKTSAGVAVFDAETGAGFAWAPLADAARADDGSLVLRARTTAIHDICVTAASAREFARHGYFAKTSLAASAASSREVELSVATARVRFLLPDGAERAGPLRLRRLDDPRWMPIESGGTGLTIAPGEESSILLGAGTYEVADPIDDTRSQRFEVPGEPDVTLDAALTTARVDRP